MRRTARSLATAASLLVLTLAGVGCSSGSPWNIFTFRHSEGGNVAASDGLGAALASRAQPQAAKTATVTEKVESR